jgi:hypothetical protein
MWMFFLPSPLPDATYWPGRRGLAVADALIWPLMWVCAVNEAGVSTGIVGPLVTAVAVLSGLARVHKALYANARYRFTTWRWGRIAVALLLVGAVLKLMLGA